MSRNLRFVAPLLLIAAVAFVGIDQTAGSLVAQEAAPAAPAAPEKPAVPAVPATLETLCPEGVVAFIRINNLKQLDAEILELVKLIEPEEVDDASPLQNLGKMMDNPTMEGVATDKPIGVGLSMSAMGPLPVVIMSLSDPAAFSVKTAGNENVRVLGTFAVWSPDPDLAGAVKVAEQPSALAASLPDGDIAIAVNMEVARPLMEPMFGMMDQGIEMLKQQMPGPIGDFYVEMAANMKAIVDDAESLTLAANLKDGKLEFVENYTAKEGSETAKKLAAVKTSRKSLLGYVDSADFMAIEMRGTGQDIWDSFGSFYEGMFAEADAETLAMLKESVMLLDGMAVGVGFDGGLSKTFVMGVTDEEKYAKLLDQMPQLFEKMMDGMMGMMPGGADLPMDMGFTQGETWEHAGVKVRNYSFKMAFKESPDLPPEMVANMKQMMTKMFGGETIDYHVAIVNGLAIGAVGTKARERTAAMIENVKSGKMDQLPAPVASALAGFPVNSYTRFNMDFASILKMVADMPEVPEEVKPKLMNAPAGLGMSGYLTYDGRSMKFGMRCNLKVIASFAASFMR